MRPVRHSANLKPSACAIASIIFELTVEATIASRAVEHEHVNICSLDVMKLRTDGLPGLLVPL